MEVQEIFEDVKKAYPRPVTVSTIEDGQRQYSLVDTSGVPDGWIKDEGMLVLCWEQAGGDPVYIWNCCIAKAQISTPASEAHRIQTAFAKVLEAYPATIAHQGSLWDLEDALKASPAEIERVGQLVLRELIGGRGEPIYHWHYITSKEEMSRERTHAAMQLVRAGAPPDWTSGFWERYAASHGMPPDHYVKARAAVAFDLAKVAHPFSVEYDGRRWAFGDARLSACFPQAQGRRVLTEMMPDGSDVRLHFRYTVDESEIARTPEPEPEFSVVQSHLPPQRHVLTLLTQQALGMLCDAKDEMDEADAWIAFLNANAGALLALGEVGREQLLLEVASAREIAEQLNPPA